jgi:hypothetical protein
MSFDNRTTRPCRHVLLLGTPGDALGAAYEFGPPRGRNLRWRWWGRGLRLGAR